MMRSGRTGLVLAAMAMGGAAGLAQTPDSASAVNGQATNRVGAAGVQAVQRGVEAIVSMRQRPVGTVGAAAGHKKSYELNVGGGEWVDSGATVTAGEQASFSATGTVTLQDGRAVTADGSDRGWKDLLRGFPLNTAKAGALVGRVSDVGASVPFLIGSESTVTMPTSGRLFLRANVSDDLAGSGEFKVKVKFAEGAKAAGATGVQKEALAVSTEVSPGVFAEVPRRVSDEAGNDGDMVNYALVGTEEQVKAAFQNAGWVAVDKTVGEAVLHGVLSTLSHEAYLEMPMSTLYLFGRPQDLSFARADPLKVAAERHHLRVWKTDQTVDGKPLWVGSATHDIGFEKDERNGKTTHKIDPKIDDERQFLLQSFDATGAFSSAAYVTPDHPLKEARTATGGSFFSDGRILVMELK